MQYFIANCIFICSFLTKRFFMPYFYILILGLRFGKMFYICLHCALAVGIIPVVGHEAIVIGSRQAVFLVPAELALGCGGIQRAVLLDVACIDIDKIAVGIVSIGMVVVHLCHGVRLV